MLVHHFLEQSALDSPEKTAVVHDDRRATYTEINAQANRLARWLVENGVKKGDRVVLFLENSLAYIVGYYGTLKAGAVTVPLSVDLKAASLDAIIAEIDPKLIISTRRLEREIGLVDPRLLSRLKLLIRDPQTRWGPSMQAFAWDDVTGGGPFDSPDVSKRRGSGQHHLYLRLCSALADGPSTIRPWRNVDTRVVAVPRSTAMSRLHQIPDHASRNLSHRLLS